MAKASEVVKRGVQELTAKLKEIKDADEEDLGKISQAFDDIGNKADELAEVLARADHALTGKNEDDQDDEDAEQEDTEDEDEPEEEQEQPQSKQRSKTAK